MKSYKIKYSYVSAGNLSLIEKWGCYMSSSAPIESDLIGWAVRNTIGGGFDYKILSISEPY